jgi:hypothetical protein
MHVEVKTDNHIRGSEELSGRVRDTVEAAFGRYSHQITRMEVHLADENGHKKGQGDKRCSMEAKPAGHPPLAVTHHADTLDEAIDGAADRLTRLLESTFGWLADHKGRASAAGEQGY